MGKLLPQAASAARQARAGGLGPAFAGGVNATVTAWPGAPGPQPEPHMASLWARNLNITRRPGPSESCQWALALSSRWQGTCNGCVGPRSGPSCTGPHG